jgi:hypothetical protein
MGAPQSTVISMRLPSGSGLRLKRLASRHGWTPSDTSARLVEEGLRRAEFAFIDFRDSAVGRQAYVQGTSLAVWEVILLLRSYKDSPLAVARHLRWPVGKVAAAANYAEAYPGEVDAALEENASLDFIALKRMLPQANPVAIGSPRKRAHAQAASR